MILFFIKIPWTILAVFNGKQVRVTYSAGRKEQNPNVVQHHNNTGLFINNYEYVSKSWNYFFRT